MEDGKPAPETENKQESSHDTDRFVRWQKLAIDQLSYTLNFTLTLTIAALGYIFTLLRDDCFNPAGYAKSSLLFSLVSLAIAAVCGLVCSIIRLWDIQSTARHVRKRPDAPSPGLLRVMGKITWVSFYLQLTGFSLGIAFLAIAMLLTYGSKLR